MEKKTGQDKGVGGVGLLEYVCRKSREVQVVGRFITTDID